MTTDMEERIAASLRSRAEREVDTGTLLAGASRRGRQLRFRRRMTVWGTAAVAVLLVAAGLATNAIHPWRISLPPAGSWKPHPLPPALTPPVAPSGTPTAAENPNVIGQDPGLFHLWFDKLPGTYHRVRVESDLGSETMEFTPSNPTAQALGADPPGVRSVDFTVTISKDPTHLGPTMGKPVPIHLNSQPATEYLPGSTRDELVPGGTRIIRWQPLPGQPLWAQVSASGGTSESQLRDIIRAVRLDTVHRCAVPYQGLAALHDARPTGCALYLDDGSVPAVGWGRAHVPPDTLYRIDNQSGTSISIQARQDRSGMPSGKPDLMVNGLNAWWSDETYTGGRLTIAAPNGLIIVVSLSGPDYGKSDAIALVAQLRLVDHPDQPGTWPPDPYH